MGIDAVIFDIGNVLLEWHPHRPFDRRLGEDRRKALFDRVPLMAMNERLDLEGDIGVEVRRMAAAHPEFADEIMIWLDHWLETLAPEIPDSIALLRALKARGVPVHALTNFGDRTFGWAEDAYPVLTEFDRRFVSARLGMMKPDPALYAHVEAELGLAPERMLFTDDKPENIATAAARGWQVHLFEGPEGLGRRLVAEGLLADGAGA